MLWAANNESFDKCAYPVVTLDKCAIEAVAAIPPETRKLIGALSPSEREHFYRKAAVDYMRTHVVDLINRSFIKLDAAFTPVFNPRLAVDGSSTSSGIKSLLYSVPYVFLLLFSAIGVSSVFRTHRRFLLLLSALATSVSIFSAIFWAHSIEKLNILVYACILAGYAIVQRLPRCEGGRAGDTRELSDAPSERI